MGNENKKRADEKDRTERRLETDPDTGLPVLVGPAFTKEDVARDFPVDCSRDAIILRRSVELGKKEPFENSKGNRRNTITKEQVAKDFPRDCCRFAILMRRSVGLTEDDMDEPLKCCFAT